MRTFAEYLGDKLSQSATVGVFHGGRLLLLRRSGTAPWMPLKYGLPGGSIEEGENPTEAAARELREETGMSLPVRKYAVITEPEYVNHLHLAFAQSPEVALNFEHDRHIWCNHDDCLNIELVPNLDKIISRFKSEGLFDKPSPQTEA